MIRHEFSSHFARHLGDELVSGGRLSQFDHKKLYRNAFEKPESEIMRQARMARPINNFPTKKHWWETA